MNIQSFLHVVPRSFKWVAAALAACAVVAGAAVSLMNVMQHHPSTLVPLAAGVAAAALAPIWILCLGFVYADARRRGMPAWLWTLVAAFIPNLLGFLLYFACRRPVATPCPHCGQPNAPAQRFCSWCGHLASGPLASEGKLA
jgi:hypothetical protein